MGISDATWFITSDCNLACEYCFTRFNKEFKREDSSIGVGIAIVDFLLMNSTGKQVSLSFFGGEPLLKFKIMKDVVFHAETQAKHARKEFSFSVTTNGTLLDKENLAFLKEHNVGLLISLDGMPHKENKRTDHNGVHSADIALDGALLALEMGFKPVIRWSLHPSMIKHVSGDLRQLVRLGFRTIALEPVYEAEWFEGDIKSYETQLLDVKEFYINELRRGNRITVKPVDDAFLNFTMEEKQTTRCGTATHGVGVDTRGNIYPCHRYVTRLGPVIGNVHTGWDESALKKAQTWDVSKAKSELGECRDCPVNIRCPGGVCPCVSLDTTGDIYISPATYCKLQRINQSIANDVVFILYAEKNAILLDKLGKPDLRT